MYSNHNAWKTIGVAILSVALVTPVLRAQSAGKEVQNLLRLEQSLLDALATGDRELWGRSLDDSCIIVIEDGSTRSKRQFLDELQPLPAGYVGKIQVTEPRGHLYENLAVLTFVDDETLELFGQRIHTRYRQTDAWLRSDDGVWRLISMKLFEIPKNPAPVQVETSILEGYQGVYELSPERTCSVYVREGYLNAKKGNRDPQPLFAETENVFFREGDGRVNVIFRRNAEGVFEMIERREGEDLVWHPSKHRK